MNEPLGISTLLKDQAEDAFQVLPCELIEQRMHDVGTEMLATITDTEAVREMSLGSASFIREILSDLSRVRMHRMDMQSFVAGRGGSGRSRVLATTAETSKAVIMAGKLKNAWKAAVQETGEKYRRHRKERLDVDDANTLWKKYSNCKGTGRSTLRDDTTF